MLDQLKSKGCEIIGCDRLEKIYNIDRLATNEDWATEYLEKKISVKIVDNIEGSVDHINLYASGHTESCLTDKKSSINISFKIVRALFLCITLQLNLLMVRVWFWS